MGLLFWNSTLLYQGHIQEFNRGIVDCTCSVHVMYMKVEAKGGSWQVPLLTIFGHNIHAFEATRKQPKYVTPVYMYLLLMLFEWVHAVV